MAALRTRIRGQEAVLRQLHKMRTLQRPASGLLFAGPPGVGKTLVAWSSMQEVLCTEQVPSGACGSCGSCRKVENQSHESILKISSASRVWICTGSPQLSARAICFLKAAT